MEKITINGEELNITFNFAAELAYEDLTGKEFDAYQILPKEGTPKSSDVIKVAFACIIANNKDRKTDSDYILYKATREEVATLVAAAIREMLAWLGVPAIAEQHVNEPAEVDTSPNA